MEHDNLPVPTSTFVGREREVEEVRRRLAEARLVTLTGPGSCGKTRLAIAAAECVRAVFRHGIWWVGLASLADPALVPQAVAPTLGVRERRGRPLPETLTEALRPRQ